MKTAFTHLPTAKPTNRCKACGCRKIRKASEDFCKQHLITISIRNGKSLAPQKPTKGELVAALLALGFEQSGTFPVALRSIPSAGSFTPDGMEFARYMVADDDFGGCWNDGEQIEMHTRAAVVAESEVEG